MRRNTARILAIGLVGLVTVLAAGCGGGSKAPATTAQAPASTTSSTSSSSTTSGGAATTASSSSSLGSLASASNCTELSGLGAAFAQAIAGTGSNNTQQSAQLLDEFAANAPAAVQPDFQVVAAAFTKIAAALKGYTPGATPNPAELSKLESLSTSLNQSALTKAFTDIATWAASNCH